MNQRKQIELIEQLASICEELGWVIALPNQEEKVPGLIMGNEEFVAEVIQAYYGEDVEVFKKSQGAEGMEPMDDFGGPGKKKQTVH